MTREEIAWEILCARNTIAYIVDIDTYELLFLSPGAMELFHVFSEEQYKGKKCYGFLQGFRSPCSFCKNMQLQEKAGASREVYNECLKGWVLLEHNEISMEGRNCRLEVLRDISTESWEFEEIAHRLEDKDASHALDEIEVQKMLKQLSHASYTDFLTEVGNRNYYQKTVQELAEHQPESIGIVYVDINGLKTANDKYGHDYGDYLLRRTASILKQHFEQQVFRVGGDEFIILCLNPTEEMFQSRLCALKQSFEQDKYCSVSIGSVWKDREYILANEIMLADRLMYIAKQKYYSSQRHVD